MIRPQQRPKDESGLYRIEYQYIRWLEPNGSFGATEPKLSHWPLKFFANTKCLWLDNHRFTAGYIISYQLHLSHKDEYTINSNPYSPKLHDHRCECLSTTGMYTLLMQSPVKSRAVNSCLIAEHAGLSKAYFKDYVKLSLVKSLYVRHKLWTES